MNFNKGVKRSTHIYATIFIRNMLVTLVIQFKGEDCSFSKQDNHKTKPL